MTLPPTLAVFVGGCIGGTARLTIDSLVPTADGAVPWEILAINVVGSLLLGALAAHALVHGARWWTPMVGTGALGGFTTFSAVAVLTWSTDSSLAVAAALLGATMVAAVLAAAVGWRIGSRDVA